MGLECEELMESRWKQGGQRDETTGGEKKESKGEGYRE